MKSVDLPLYQRVGIKRVIFDHKGFWSNKREGFGGELVDKERFFFNKNIEMFS